MKPNLLFTLLGVVLVLILLFAWGYANRADAPTVSGSAGGAVAGALASSETFYDFGTISMKDGNVTKEFTITNGSDTETTLRTLITSCMCTTAFIVGDDGTAKGPYGMPGHGASVPPANETIAAGEDRIIRVVFDPNAHGPAGVGRIDRVITMTDSSGGTLELRIVANVTP